MRPLIVFLVLFVVYDVLAADECVQTNDERIRLDGKCAAIRTEVFVHQNFLKAEVSVRAGVNEDSLRNASLSFGECNLVIGQLLEISGEGPSNRIAFKRVVQLSVDVDGYWLWREQKPLDTSPARWTCGRRRNSATR
ncbi:hypothetical protein M3Y99_01001100 [Aphelenchoides fujianensis]|nr:hypothetical protein M3Y99_01001100 [Aphelenchoides fujianensis]